MIPISQIKQIVDFIFSKDGYSIHNLNISFPQPLNIKIIKNDSGDIILSFTESLPKVSWNRLIKLSAWIQGISLGKTSGTLKLKYLPDINFSYEDDNKKEILFGSDYDFSSIEKEINFTYEDDERKFLAHKCLHYASEWATIASQSCDFACSTYTEQKKLKQDCKNFVIENIRNEQKYGSVVLTFLLLYIVLPVVLKFVLERLFNKLFN